MRLSKEDVGNIIVNFPYEPIFNKVIITLNNLEVDGDLILSENVLSERQYLVAGEIIYRDKKICPGDEVLIDIEKMMVPVKTETNNAYEVREQIKIDPIEVDGKTFAIIEDRFIKSKILK